MQEVKQVYIWWQTIILIVHKLEWVARAAILSGVEWVGSAERLAKITSVLGISRLGSAGRVARLYTVTNNNINSVQAKISR